MAKFDGRACALTGHWVDGVFRIDFHMFGRDEPIEMASAGSFVEALERALYVANATEELWRDDLTVH